MYKSVSHLKHTTSTSVKSNITLCKNEHREREPDVSMTIGMFLSRANLKTFSSLINYKDLHIFGLRKKERKKERKARSHVSIF
jgi:hypothetical protein